MPVKLQLFNSLGEMVYNKENANAYAGRHILSIEVSDLKPGIYYYNVTDGIEEVTGKAIKVE